MRIPGLNTRTFQFIRDSVLMVNAGALAGLLYLLVHPVLGRHMTSLDYAAFVQVLGLLNFLGVPAAAGQVAITRYVAEYVHGNQLDLWTMMFWRATRRLLWVGGAGLAGWIVCVPWLSRQLHVASPVSLVIVGVAAFVSLFLPVVMGSLQGAMRFGWLAAASVGSGLFRLLLTGTAVMVRNSVNAALAGVCAGFVATLALGCVPLRRVVAGAPPLAAFDTRPIYRYLWPVLIGLATVQLLVNADLILSARLLSGDQLAMYGKVAMLSRIVLFIAQPIAVAMFPRAVNTTSLRVLLMPLAAAFGITLTGALVLTVCPGLPMRLMYGVDDPAYDRLTRMYIWAILPHAMVMFTTQYLWARDQPRRILFLLPVLAVYGAALLMGAHTPERIIAWLAAAGFVSAVIVTVAVMVRQPATPLPAEASPA